MKRQIGIAVVLLLSVTSLFAEDLHYTFLPYTAPSVPGTTESPNATTWTVSRHNRDSYVDVTFEAEIVFYLFGRLSYSYSGSGRYDEEGSLIQAQTTIETMARRGTVTVDEEAIGAALSIMDARPLNGEEALAIALTFLNPETVRNRVVPGGEILFPRVDLAQGAINGVFHTVEVIDSPRFQRSVLRVASRTMEFLFHPETHTLLYAFTRDIGFGAELILNETEASDSFPRRKNE